jgi:hypothetical protein
MVRGNPPRPIDASELPDVAFIVAFFATALAASLLRKKVQGASLAG